MAILKAYLLEDPRGHGGVVNHPNQRIGVGFTNLRSWLRRRLDGLQLAHLTKREGETRRRVVEKWKGKRKKKRREYLSDNVLVAGIAHEVEEVLEGDTYHRIHE